MKIAVQMTIVMSDEMAQEYAKTYDLLGRDGKPSPRKIGHHVRTYAGVDVRRGPLGDYAEIKVAGT